MLIQPTKSNWLARAGMALLLAGGLVGTGYGQDFRRAVDDMRERYASSPRVHLVMQVRAYASAGSSQAVYEQTVTVFKEGDKFLYQLPDSEVLMNEGHYLMVNNESRSIVCRSRSVADEKVYRAQPMLNVDSLLRFYEAPAYLGLTKGTGADQRHRYLIEPKRGPIIKVEAQLSATDHTLRELLYYYKSGQFVRIEFLRFDTPPAFAANLFNERRFVLVAGGRYRATGKFSDYQIYQ